MLVGLLSDTHITDPREALPPQLIEAFHGVDLILHAGDIYVPSVLDELEQIAPVLAARGDDDFGATLTDRRVKDKHIVTLDGVTVWLIHERPYSLMSPWWQSQVFAEPNRQPDVIVFGHEHRTDLAQVGDILFVNPGSPTFLNYRYGLGTVGILNIDSGEANVELRQL